MKNIIISAVSSILVAGIFSAVVLVAHPSWSSLSADTGQYSETAQATSTYTLFTVSTSTPNSTVSYHAKVASSSGLAQTNSLSSNTQKITTAYASQVGVYYVFVKPNSYYAIPGSQVSFSGSHFYPNELVTIRTKGGAVGTIQADSTGNFQTGNFPVYNSHGNQAFEFVGSTSAIPFTVTISTNAALPWLTLNNYYAGAGSSIVITGHGFAANEPVTLSFAGSTLGIIQASAQGEFSATAIVSPGGVGNKDVVATGLNTKQAATTHFSQAY